MVAAATFWKVWKAPYHRAFEEAFECTQCNGFIALKNIYCKHCGCSITNADRDEMKGMNDPKAISGYAIGIPFFLVVAILLTVIISWMGK